MVYRNHELGNFDSHLTAKFQSSEYYSRPLAEATGNALCLPVNHATDVDATDHLRTNASNHDAIIRPKSAGPAIENPIETLTLRCNDLEAKVQLFHKERELTDKRTLSFKKQIEVRDKEISHLRRIIEGEKTSETMELETQQRQSGQVIERLKLQVDLLQTRNEELEKRLLFFPQPRGQYATTNTQVSPSHERASQCVLLGHPVTSKMDRYDLVEMLESFEKTSNHFFGRTDELVNCQKKMVLEIERLKRLIPPASKQSSAVKRCSIRTTIKKAPLLSATATSAATAKQTAQDYEPPIKGYIEGLLADRETLRAQVESLNHSLRRWLAIDTETKPLTSEIPTGDNQGPRTSEVDIRSDKAPIGNTTDPQVAVEINGELEIVKRERDELLTSLNTFERNLLVIQDEIRSLRSERDRLLIELQKTRKSEISIGLQTSLSEAVGPEHMENLRQTSNNAAQGSDALPPRGRDSTEMTQQAKEIRFLKEALAGSREHANQLELQVEQMKCDAERIISQKADVEIAKKQLEAALMQSRGQNFALTSELAMRKNMYNEVVKGKQVSNAMITEVQHDLQRLNARNVELDAEVRSSRERVSCLHNFASKLEAEKDALQTDLNNRTEELASLRFDLTRYIQLLEEKQRHLDNVELRLREVTETATKRDCEIVNLTKLLHELEASSQVVSQSRIISEGKYANAKSEMVVLVNEIESLRARLQTAVEENTKMHCCLDEVLQKSSASDRALEAKSKEFTDLLLQYGALTKEFDATQKRNSDLERTLTTLEQAVQTNEASIKNHIERLQKSELEALNANRQCIIVEEKCTRLGIAADRAESRVQQLNAEIAEVQRDLAAARDLSDALQTRLDNTTCQWASTLKDLVAKLNECERKLSNSLTETARQREIVQQLELLLSASRENQAHLQAALDRKAKEYEQLHKETQPVTTDAPVPHRLVTVIPKHSNGVGASTLVVPTTVDAKSPPLLFYKPLDPSASIGCTSLPPAGANWDAQGFSSLANTSNGTGISGAIKSSVKFYEPLTVSESPSTNISSV